MNRSYPFWVCSIVVLSICALLLIGTPRESHSYELSDIILTLGTKNFRQKKTAVENLAALNDLRILPVLRAMAKGELFMRKSDKAIVIGEKKGSKYVLRDAMTLKQIGTATRHELRKITVNNRLRITIRAAISKLLLFSPDPAQRLAAANNIIKNSSVESAGLLREALKKETDPTVRKAMTFSMAVMNLHSSERGKRLAAIETLSDSLDPQVRTILSQIVIVHNDGSFAEPDRKVREAAQSALNNIKRKLKIIDFLTNLFQGVSLGSVLLLASIGLAITFGVMGVINMAHGEMIMLGAYTTFVVQEVFKQYLPVDLFGYYLPFALPAAFCVGAGVGFVLERGIIRFLYGRPLETLLATWGISLILQQAVRSIFGATNREVANPAWMTGGIEIIGGAVLTYNRIYIIIFSLVVFIVLMLLMRWTTFGLHMRAVTQNRDMASVMGVPSGRIDALTFSLGAGIAGMAGVALSQIGNVSPNLGQTYIVDSFMVVVFGGVGNLFGTMVGAMTLGLVNKFLEPYSGAMLGKIIVLVFIILFIQKHPRGLFALKGRAVEI